MNPSNDIRICISPSQGKIIIEEQDGPVTTRKEVDQQSLISCFKNSLRTDDPGFSSGFLPLNCLSVWQGNEGKRFVLWHPKLYADITLYDTPYPHFPIPRMVFGFSVDQAGTVSQCRIGVVADETPTPDTAMYHYPFSNVSEGSGHLCVGVNTMPMKWQRPADSGPWIAVTEKRCISSMIYRKASVWCRASALQKHRPPSGCS